MFDNLLRTGLIPSDITHVFFSHLHSDHMLDYARLIHAAWDEGGAQIKVIGPKPVQFVTDGLFGPNGVLSYDIRARTELKPSQQVWVARGGTLPRPWPSPSVQEIVPGFQCSESDWTLRSCEVPHAQPVFACVAYSLEAEGKKFVYSGDAAQCETLKELAQGADVLLHWCYRFDDELVQPALAAMTPTPSEIGGACAPSRSRIAYTFPLSPKSRQKRLVERSADRCRDSVFGTGRNCRRLGGLRSLIPSTNSTASSGRPCP